MGSNNGNQVALMQQLFQQMQQTAQGVNIINQNLTANMKQMDNLSGLTMLNNCMQVALINSLDEEMKNKVISIYQLLCKQYGVKPMTDETKEVEEENNNEISS